MALLQQCSVAELTAGGCPGIFWIHSLPNELLRQQLKMHLHLTLKFGIRLFPSEMSAHFGNKSKNRGSHFISPPPNAKRGRLRQRSAPSFPSRPQVVFALAG